MYDFREIKSIKEEDYQEFTPQLQCVNVLNPIQEREIVMFRADDVKNEFDEMEIGEEGDTVNLLDRLIGVDE